MADERTWLVADRVCLGDPGDHWQAVTIVGPTGEITWTLTEPDHECAHCPLGQPPDHERVGSLPRQVRDRLRESWPRCGAPASHGAPCRSLVPRPGVRCHHHQHHGAGGGRDG